MNLIFGDPEYEKKWFDTNHTHTIDTFYVIRCLCRVYRNDENTYRNKKPPETKTPTPTKPPPVETLMETPTKPPTETPTETPEHHACTPGFWKQPHHFQHWEVIDPDDAYNDDMTFLEALQGGKNTRSSRVIVAGMLYEFNPDAPCD
jgi:hypothetical protein